MRCVITLNTVKTLVQEQFPEWGDLPIVPVVKSGWDHHTFHLGKKMLLRFPSAEGYVPQVHKEQKWLPFLAPKLLLQIPLPLRLGKPGNGYQWPWSIYKWIEGETAESSPHLNKNKFAGQLAHFLNTLYKIETKNGPKSGEHNYHRGGNLLVYEKEVITALNILKSKLDTITYKKIWDIGADTEWQRPPVWVHGDISSSNLLIKHNDLNAVIDFELLSVGDPACDLAIAWTFLDALARKRFRKLIDIDDATWQRGRSWALWKALIIAAKLCYSNVTENASAEKVIFEIFQDYILNDL